MLRISFCLSIAAAVCAGCTASSAPSGDAGAAAAIDESEWRIFQPAGAGMRVLMPGTPVDLSADPEISIYGVVLPGEVEYTVSWSDHSAEVARVGPDAALELARESQILLGERELLKDEAIQVHGYPAREVVSVDADRFVLHCRMVMVQDRLYQAAWTTPESSYAAVDADLRRFLDSFEIVQ